MEQIICVDTREKLNKKQHVLQEFDRLNIKYVRSKLFCGDYTLLHNQSICVDLKTGGLNEVESNLISDHERFRNECIRAQDNGIRLIVLVEQDTVRELKQVYAWKNPRRAWWDKIDRAHSKGQMLHRAIPSKPPADGPLLYKIMQTMAERYGVEWRFCVHQDAGKTICRILEGLQPR